MQLPGAPSVDIVSVYAQLAEDGAVFLAVVALLYSVGRLLVVPGVARCPPAPLAAYPSPSSPLPAVNLGITLIAPLRVAHPVA
jgi:hypothetical protein